LKRPLHACWIASLVLAWAVSSLAPAAAQTDGVPNEQTLEESLRKKPVTPKASPNPGTAKKAAEPAGDSPAPPKPAHRGAPIPMVVVSDAACALEVNGDPIAALDPGAVKKLNVYPGDQLVKCASTEEPGEIYSAVQNIKAGEQTVLQIGLASHVAAVRQKREAQAQSLAAEDELWAQAGQNGAAANLQAYLDKYPDGRYADQAKGFLTEATRRAEEDAAKQRMEIMRQLPARPDLPLPVGDDIWGGLENSPYYMNLPRRTRKVTVSVSITVHGEPTKGTSLSRSQATTRDIVPSGDKCVMLHSVTRKSEANDAPPDVMDEYQCGELKLESVVNGKVIRAASLSDVEAFLQNDTALREKPPCEVPSSGPASAFHAALTGTATRYGCSSGEYYFEDLNVWLYELGELDPEKQQYILPSPGYHFEAVAGDSGGKITTTYDAFSWTDGN
jgi:TolA-binding protein